MRIEMVGAHVSSQEVGCCHRVVAYRLQEQPEDCCNLAICNQKGTCAKEELVAQGFVIEYPKEKCREGN